MLYGILKLQTTRLCRKEPTALPRLLQQLLGAQRDGKRAVHGQTAGLGLHALFLRGLFLSRKAELLFYLGLKLLQAVEQQRIERAAFAV